MIVELRFLDESFSTDVTQVWFFAQMAKCVSVQVGSLGETSSAVVAYKGFLASVDPAVHLQIGGMAEGFVALQTGKQLLLASLVILDQFDFMVSTLKN